jgi:hypothetical protein
MIHHSDHHIMRLEIIIGIIIIIIIIIIIVRIRGLTQRLSSKARPHGER